MVGTLLGVVGRRVWGQHRGGAGILKAEAALESEERKAFWPPCLETLMACSSPNEPLCLWFQLFWCLAPCLQLSRRMLEVKTFSLGPPS